MTVKLTDVELPLASVAVQVTEVTPTGKPEPGGREYVMAGEGSQLSVAVAANVTGTSKAGLQGMVMFGHGVIFGGVLSRTVTLN